MDGACRRTTPDARNSETDHTAHAEYSVCPRTPDLAPSFVGGGKTEELLAQGRAPLEPPEHSDGHGQVAWAHGGGVAAAADGKNRTCPMVDESHKHGVEYVGGNAAAEEGPP